MNVLNEESPVHAMMYHGSNLKFDKLKPTAYNAGHRLKKHSWSVFMWPDYELAYRWAVFVTLNKTCKPLKQQGIINSRAIGQHEKTGLNDYEYKLYIYYKDYDAMVDYVKKVKPKFYVYIVEAPIDMNFSIGNVMNAPEYTYDGELNIHRREEHTLTEEIIRNLFEPVNDKQYEDLKFPKGDNIRGPIGVLFYPTKDVIQKWRYVYKKIEAGDIEPGDDLDPVIDEYEKVNGDKMKLKKEDIKTPLVLSQDDIYANFDKWVSKESHVLFVIGLSGSGKSTLARKMAEEYNAYYVEIDVIAFCIVGQKTIDRGHNNFEYIKRKDILLYKYMKEKHIDPNFLTHLSIDPETYRHTEKEEEFKRQEIDKYIHWLCFEQNERAVIAGGHAAVTITRHPDIYKDLPIIFKGTSLTKSVFRRIVRCAREGDIYSPLRWITVIRAQYLDKMLPEMNKARKSVLDGRDDIVMVKEDYNNYKMIFKKSTDGTYNAITYINGKMYRPRAEILILNEEGEILIRKSKEVNQYGTKYNLPGGGFDNAGETPEDVAIREATEEVRIIPKDVRFVNIMYVSEYGDRVPEWHKRILWPEGIVYVGAVSYVCVGVYGKKYNAYIKKRDRQDYIDEYEFYPYNSIKDMLRQEHIEALESYKINQVHEGVTNFGTMDIDISDRNQHNYKAKKIKVPSGIKNFKEFCQKIPNPIVALAWFIKNKIKWTPNGGDNDHVFQWPDYLISQKMGNCFDQTIFMHYYCQKKHIDHKMFLITWIGDNGNGSGHAVPMYKKGEYVYVWLYLRPGVGQIGGPFRSWDEAQDTLNYYFSVAINRVFHTPTTPYSSFLSDDDLKKFDQYYNDRTITQTEYITMGLGSNMRSSHMFKLKYKGFMFPNPVLPVYDVVITAIQLLAFANHIIPIDLFKEETNLLEEDYKTDKRMPLDYRKLKSPKGIKTFDEFCKKIDTVPMMLKWFMDNKITWHSENNKVSVQWPDDIIETKKGICFDHAIFMHYFCNRKKIPNKIMLMSWVPDSGFITGHAMLIFEYKEQYYCPVYLCPGLGWMAGPYRSWEEARENLHQIHLGAISYSLGSPTTPYSVLLNEDDEKVLDKYYGRHDITSEKIIMEFRSSQFVKIRFKGMLFPNPRVYLSKYLQKLADMFKYNPSFDDDSYWTKNDNKYINVKEK